MGQALPRGPLIPQQKAPVDHTALGSGMVMLRCSHGKKWNKNWSKMCFWTAESSFLKNDLPNPLQGRGDCTFLKSHQLPPPFTLSLLRLYAPNGLSALPCFSYWLWVLAAINSAPCLEQLEISILHYFFQCFLTIWYHKEKWSHTNAMMDVHMLKIQR